MAEAVLFQLAAELIKKLGSHVVQEIALWWGAKDELEELKDTVCTIKAVLSDAEKQHAQNEQVRVWLGRLKDAMYDADDLLDDFSTEALQRQLMSSIGNDMRRQVRLFFSRSNQFAYGFKMGSKIKAIRKRLDAISKDRVRFHLQEGPVEEKSYMRGGRETHSYVCGDDVIGRDEDKEKIIKMLLNSEENILVVPIVGIGGLGKTTLAQFVYNDEIVQKSFDLRVWVCVSDPFDVKLIVKKMIKSVTYRDPGDLEMDQLQNQFREKIDGKKYLLVLDDVWNEDRNKWLNLEHLLRDGMKGSRMIVTARSTKVAESVGVSSPYVLKGLSENKAWGLFMRVAVKRGEEPKNEGVVEIGKKIVRKCAGVPLAIKTIGSLLYFKDPVSEWSLFENKEFPGTTQKEDDILPTLKLSYDYLPSYLKNCFAYCKLFPKDHRIDVLELIYLWMAQGLIESSNQGQCLEDIGMEYFKELLCRSFFQDVENDKWGNVRYCKMHDLMHDLAISVGGTESVLMSNSNDESLIDEKTRHVSFHFFDIDSASWQIPMALLEQNKIRTLLRLFFYGRPSEAQLNSIILNSRKLRTLEFHDLNFVTVPNSIGKLKHLRYLTFFGSDDLETLPNSITKLQNLQVLKLLNCSNLQRLPPKIRKLVSLRCLEIEGCDELSYMPRGIGQLSSLQRLDRFIVDNRDDPNGEPSAGLSELNGLNNLRGDLTIENLGYLKNGAGECRAANLKAKKHLQSLNLRWDRNSDEPSTVADEDMSMEFLEPHPNLKQLSVEDYDGARFPSWLSSLTNLVGLRLRNVTNCRHLPGLDRLTCLQSLEIHFADNMEYIIEENDVHWDSVFPSLKKLDLCGCPNLNGWGRRRDDHNEKGRELPWFPCLSQLFVRDCPKLSTMPSFPSVEVILVAEGSSWKLVQQTMRMKMKMSCSTSSSLPFPLSKLKSLTIWSLEDLECLAEEGFRGLTCLRSLTIERCGRLNSVSGVLQHLTALEKLRITDCKELDLSDLDDLQFQGLESLNIGGLPKLETLPESLQHVVSLKELSIWECPNLKSLLPSGAIQRLTALESLTIWGCKELDLSQEQFQGLQRLSRLRIGELPKLESLPESLQHVVSLKKLSIWECPNLKSLLPSGAIQRLTALESLTIKECAELDLSQEQFQGLQSLSRLEIRGLPKLESLPESLQHVVSLKELSIWKCHNLKSLLHSGAIQRLTALEDLRIGRCKELDLSQEQFQGLQSLSRLEIGGLPKLKSLPESLQHVVSLKQLTIWGCPHLSKTCQKYSGTDWPKIAHIPFITIDGRFIQGWQS